MATTLSHLAVSRRAVRLQSSRWTRARNWGSDRYVIAEEKGQRRDHLSPEARSLAMSKVHRRDTSAELRLRRGLWRSGLRGWRCDVPSLPGRPDLAFSRWHVAVFVDGLLWHGHPKRYPARLSEAWREKIARNVQRDRSVDVKLTALGWQVVRLWDAEVTKDLAGSIDRVHRALVIAGAPAEWRTEP